MDKSSYLLQYTVLRPILQYVQIQTISLTAAYSLALKLTNWPVVLISLNSSRELIMASFALGIFLSNVEVAST